MSFAERTTRFASLAAQRLGWRPAEFWAATPAELALALADPDPPPAPPGRDEIHRMMERDENGR